MIDIYNGQITDLLTNETRYNPEVIALAYAIQQEKQRILRELERTRTMAVIDELPESILDVLAVELRTPYYTDTLSIDVKREVIQKSLLWAAKAGTTSAVEELVQTVFGQGQVVEWFNFTEGPQTPGTFDIVTDAQLQPDSTSFFTRVIKRAKNTRSHIRRVLVERKGQTMSYTAAAAQLSSTVKIRNSAQLQYSVDCPQAPVKLAVLSIPSIRITN